MFGGLLLSSLEGGYLASATALDSPVGSADCPWIIEGQPGQFINLTGWSFDLTSFDRRQSAAEPCSTLAAGRSKVTVEDGNRTLSMTSCPSDAHSPRQRHWSVTSQGHQVKVFIQATPSDETDQNSSADQQPDNGDQSPVNGPYYLLKYEGKERKSEGETDSHTQ